jgi:Tfp pilus assembly protein FimT
MIVLVLVGGIVAPAFSNFLPSVRVRKAGDELLSALAKARSDAALTSRRIRIVFAKTDPPSYRMTYEPDPMNDPATFRAMPGEWGAPIELPEGVQVESIEGAGTDDATSEEYLEFSPDGTATGARITLSHEGGDQVTILVESADGRAAVEVPEEAKR